MKYPLLACLLFTTPALADITPEDLLESWQTVYTEYGETVTVESIEVNGKVTRFNNIERLSRLDGVDSTYRAEWMDLRSNPDGSVDISFSPITEGVDRAVQFDVSVKVTEVEFDLSALNVRATGSPGDIHYSGFAPVISVKQGGDVGNITFLVTLRGVTLEGYTLFVVTESGPRVSDKSHFEVESASLSITDNFKEEDPLFVSVVARSLGLDIDANFPLQTILENPRGGYPFSNSFRGELSVFSGPLLVVSERTTGPDENHFEYTSRSSEASFGMIGRKFEFGVLALDSQISMVSNSPSVPNFSAGFSEALFSASVPFGQVGVAAPYQFTTELSGFSLAESMWAKIDPEHILARGPASFAVSLSGKLKMLVDIMDDEAMANYYDVPFEVETVSLDRFVVAAEGMNMAGVGEVFLNNNRMDPNTGLPEAVGTIDFSVTGALGLLDKIAQLGVTDAMTIIGVKGALGMFGTPGEAADEFSSRIEMLEGGQINVNGQQVR